MGEVCVDFLESYRKFFDSFTLSVDPSDQLPVKVAGYNLYENEIAGAVADWSIQYLEQRKCPPFLIGHLVRKVVEEVRVLSKIDPISCGYRGEVGDFLSLKLMQACIHKLIAVCARYRDNAELSSLPPPQPLLPVTSCAIKNSRRSMEDRHVVIHDFHALFNIKGHGPASYYGVFDGHNGIDAAIYSVSHLHQYLAESPHYPTNPMLAIKDACFKTDERFTIKAERENLHGGTTAVFALLRPKDRKLYVAWLGDSQAALVRQGVPMQIVKPHKPDRTDERDRIEGMGGTVLYWGAWRVNGQLAVSRAIGDIEYKPYVTAVPDVEEITLDGTEDFLILACDGLWDFVTEEEATNAVFQQLQENPEDLEAVSHRLVALSKEHCSQDNISVVVVFLTSPAELAKRRPMETASPNPFLPQNGAEVFCGGAPNITTNGQHRPGAPTFDDDEDFGPETDVDMVDDVLLSPAIAAAKALVQGKGIEDDLERQRQQLSDFDDPADLDRSRDTPTPPAHEVASNANADNLAESGGEDSEEEWNYIPGKDTKPDTDTQEQDDMSSQLNPDAAEFVPVSPTRLLLLDDAIISASPSIPVPLTNPLPSEREFCIELSQRPSDFDISNGPKRGDDYFMRDNFSTLRNKGKDFNVSSTCPELGAESNISFNSATETASEHIPFDKLEAVQNMNEKENIFGISDDFSCNALAATNTFGKSDPMTTSVMGLKDLAASPETEESSIPDTPKSTVVEAPVSPSNGDISPLNHQTDLDSPADEFLVNTQKSPELLSPSEGHQDGLTSGQERTSSSGFESESGAEEGETNVTEENSEGFVTEHRRSPPIDLSFKPIEKFSDTNPFGALQTPTSSTPLDHFALGQELSETPKKDIMSEPAGEGMDFLQNTPSSFISLRRTPTDDAPVPFDELESPEEIPHFEHPPNANSSLLASELPKSPEPHQVLENMLASIKQEPLDSHFINESLGDTNVNDITQEDLFAEETNPHVQETSFSTEFSPGTGVSTLSHLNLDTTAGFLNEESKILQDEQECEQKSKLDGEADNLEIAQQTEKCLIPEEISSSAVEKVLTAFDGIKDNDPIEIKREPQDEDKETDVELETKEMKLEFESHIASSDTTPQELKNIADSFEVISKDELTLEDNIQLKESVCLGQVDSKENVDPCSPTKQTNPFMDNLSSELKPEEVKPETAINDFASAIDSFSSAITEDFTSQQLATLSSPLEPSTLEPEAVKKVTYQTLTPADEPKLTKTETYVTGKEEDPTQIHPANKTIAAEVIKAEEQETIASAPVLDEPIFTKSEPVQSQVVTETLITTLEEKSEFPPVTTEVPSTAGTPPPTPTPAPDQDTKEDLHNTDMLVAAVAAAGAVAAGTAVVAEREMKKVTAGATKKPSVGAVKKPSDAPAKPPGKTAPVKAPPAKAPTTKTTTTKPATTSTKPATMASAKSGSATTKTTTLVAPKTAPAKPAVGPTATKKPAAPAPVKATTTKTATTTVPKPATTTAPKSVPKQLSVNKTSNVVLKPSSKPTTPTSKPTTPTTPKSPSVMKSDVVKSPPRPTARSSLTSARPASATAKTGDESAEKKPLLNGDIKPLAKKTDVTAKKPTPTAKAPTSARPAVPTTKTAPPVVKTASTKTAAPVQLKAKVPSTTTTTTKPATVAPIKRPGSAPATKTTDKTGKETVNKQISNTKPAVNGKTAPVKTTSGVKKTDTKVNGKNPPGKTAQVKKSEEVIKEEEKPIQIQEDNVTTTNGFTEHIQENESIKIEELAPVIVDGVN